MISFFVGLWRGLCAVLGYNWVYFDKKKIGRVLGPNSRLRHDTYMGVSSMINSGRSLTVLALLAEYIQCNWRHPIFWWRRKTIVYMTGEMPIDVAIAKLYILLSGNNMVREGIDRRDNVRYMMQYIHRYVRRHGWKELYIASGLTQYGQVDDMLRMLEQRRFVGNELDAVFVDVWSGMDSSGTNPHPPMKEFCDRHGIFCVTSHQVKNDVRLKMQIKNAEDVDRLLDDVVTGAIPAVGGPAATNTFDVQLHCHTYRPLHWEGDVLFMMRTGNYKHPAITANHNTVVGSVCGYGHITYQPPTPDPAWL